MTKNLGLIILFVLVSNYCTAQFFEKYGVTLGASYSSQLWNNTMMLDQNKDYKLGFSAFLSAEKRISKLFSFRPEIGYIQKGFKDNDELTFGEVIPAEKDGENIVFHNLAADLAFKIAPFKPESPFYFLAGFRADHMISHTDIVVVEPDSGMEFNLYESAIDEFNKFNLGALVGIGFKLNRLTCIEFDYNPAITKSYNSNVLIVRDTCWGIKVGFNIINGQRIN